MLIALIGHAISWMCRGQHCMIGIEEDLLHNEELLKTRAIRTNN